MFCSTAFFAQVVTLPFITPGVILDQEVVYIPEADDGPSDAIIPDISFPFGSSDRNSIYVSYINIIVLVW